MKKFAKIVPAVLLAAGLLHGTAAFALVTQPPTSAEPGTIIKSLESKDRKPSRLEDIVTVPEMKEDLSGVSQQKVFQLKSVVLDKSETYTAEDFKGIYGKYIGQTVSFANLKEIAFAMTKKYREDGYVFSRVIIPQQNVAGGVVHFRAVEGHIAHVQIVGDYKDESGLIKSYADKIQAGGPANTKEIERYILLINDLPGVTARSFIKPSNEQGGGDLIITVEEKSFEGSASFDNRGSNYLGPYRGELVGAFNDTLGLHDRTTLRALGATQLDELSYGEISHEEQIGTEGLRLNTRFAATDTKPGGNISTQGIRGDSTLLDIDLNYPIIRSRQLNLNVIGGATGLNSETDVLGTKTAADRVRYLKAGSHLDFSDALRGVNQFDLQVAQGLRGFGATSDGLGRSRASGREDFLRGDLVASRLQDLNFQNLSLFLSATGQASADSLLASEEFTLGGPGFGRAYDAGEIAGDRGYAGSAELRYDGPVTVDWLRSYQAYIFLDGGRVFNREPAVGETGNDSVVSAGGGVRFNLIHDLSGYVELDSPLTHMVKSTDSNNSRLFFNVIKRF